MNLTKSLEQQANIIRNKSEFYNGIEIKPITVGQLIAISPHLAKIQIEDEVKTPQDFHEKLIPAISKYLEPIREIFNELFVCDFDSLIPADIASLLIIVISQIETEDFTNAITFLERLSRTTRTDVMALNERLSSTQ